ncbi:MAG: hypothetical protein SFY32_03335, partial [Bacteroidota bacterium]|nr:hypothetical protein [Bacteroidota bacterium]
MNVSIILSALKKHWIWLCIIPVFAAGTIYFVTLKSPQKFKSHAQLATGITESAEVTINENSKDNDQPYKIAQKFNNMMEIMKSRQSINLLQYKILLHELTSSKPFLYPKDVEKFITKENRPKYIKLLQYHSDSMITLNYVVESDVDIQNLINFYGIGMDELLSKISIKRLPESDFILVESETDNAAFSAFIVNCLIQEFIRYYESQKASKSAGSVDFFEKMAKIKKKELDAKVNELKSYKLKNNVINLYEQTKSIVNQLSSVEILREQENAKIPSLTKAINDIELRFTSKEKRYYEAANGKLNNKIDLLKTQLISLNQSYYQNGMTIKFQADSISLIRNQIDQLVQQSADEAIINPNAAKTELISRKLNAEIDLEIAKKTVKSIDEEINRLHGIIKSFAPMEASIGAFERE